jgi:hypothetical protein
MMGALAGAAAGAGAALVVVVVDTGYQLEDTPL